MSPRGPQQQRVFSRPPEDPSDEELEEWAEGLARELLGRSTAPPDPLSG